MPSPLEQYFFNLRQKHQVIEIVVVDDRLACSSSSEDEDEDITESEDETEPSLMTQATGLVNTPPQSQDWQSYDKGPQMATSCTKPIPCPICLKFAATTAWLGGANSWFTALVLHAIMMKLENQIQSDFRYDPERRRPQRFNWSWIELKSNCILQLTHNDCITWPFSTALHSLTAQEKVCRIFWCFDTGYNHACIATMDHEQYIASLLCLWLIIWALFTCQGMGVAHEIPWINISNHR